jgi:hypothetical protein
MSTNLLMQFLLDSHLFADKLVAYLVNFMADEAMQSVFLKGRL